MSADNAATNDEPPVCEKCGERHYGRTHPWRAIKRKRDEPSAATTQQRLAAARLRAVSQVSHFGTSANGGETFCDRCGKPLNRWGEKCHYQPDLAHLLAEDVLWLLDQPVVRRQGLTVEVKATDLPIFKQAFALLSDAYEALASARSEGWDSFSGPTREEVSNVMDAISEFADV